MTLFKKLTILSLLSSASLFAQKYTANKIVFKNHGAFTQAQLEQASGFHHGTVFTVDDLTAAANKLNDSSYFDSVGAAVDGPANSMTIIFDLKLSDPAQFLPVGFENFVWLTPAEIDTAIREQLPLYNGTILEAGPQADIVSTALKSLLAAKGVSARITRETEEPTLEHPARVIEYSIAAPEIVVVNVKIGVPAALAPLVQTSAKATIGKPYNDGLSNELTSETLLAPIRDAGYAKASLGTITFDPPTLQGNKVPLVVKGTIAPGEIYHLSTLTFAGAPLYSVDDFQKTVVLHPGDLAAHNKLMDSLAPIDKAYRAKGYADVIVAARPAFDDAAKTVGYTITVTPGQVYHMKTVTAVGLDPKAQADFDKYFLMREGEPFNPTYANDFVKNNSALASFRNYSGSWRAVSNPSTHTVDLTMTFFQAGSLQQRIVVH